MHCVSISRQPHPSGNYGRVLCQKLPRPLSMSLVRKIEAFCDVSIDVPKTIPTDMHTKSSLPSGWPFSIATFDVVPPSREVWI